MRAGQAADPAGPRTRQPTDLEHPQRHKTSPTTTTRLAGRGTWKEAISSARTLSPHSVGQYGLGTFWRRERQLGYLATGVIVVVVVIIGAAVMFVRHENRPVTRVVRRVSRRPERSPRPRRSRRVTEGDLCHCGGTVGKAGKISAKFGELLGCTGCERTWTMDGRRVVRRRVRRPVG
jgi:hypothetical protein